MSKTIDRWAFETAADAAGIEVTEDYSGRGMYGEQCIGVVFDSSGELAEFYIELADIMTDTQDAKDLASNERQDSMGMSGIAYFPSYKFEED